MFAGQTLNLRINVIFGSIMDMIKQSQAQELENISHIIITSLGTLIGNLTRKIRQSGHSRSNLTCLNDYLENLQFLVKKSFWWSWHRVKAFNRWKFLVIFFRSETYYERSWRTGWKLNGPERRQDRRSCFLPQLPPWQKITINNCLKRNFLETRNPSSVASNLWMSKKKIRLL